MAATFVPFAPHAHRTESSDLPAPSQSFSAFTPAQPEAIAASASLVEPLLSQKPACQAEPEITLVRDQDRITQIKINCPCGQVIEIACGY